MPSPTTRLASRILFNMPATRASTRSASTTPMKRKLESAEVLSSPKKPKPSPKPVISAATGTTVLTFAFEDAKQHLINADHRFEDIFSRLECKPFQRLEQLHPFRALASSILGQQISWMAARSIKHKFIRLYDPSIPEKHSDYTPSDSEAFFPTPQQVAETDIPTLRAAGLSARKVITDLAARFSDGRLSTKKLIEANDEELAEMLIEVRGAVDMFAIFSLRRPDILPVGDLGVQRGLVRWFLAQHSPTYSFTISPEKEKVASPSKKKDKKSKHDDDALPVFGEQSATVAEEAPRTPPPVEDASAIPLPPTFTPSIKRTLAKAARDDAHNCVRGAFLSPVHMEQLTASWRPYRSLGVYYMWALADAET
ncbi:DNA glycosylase [Mycena galopus ATCC 62051]|nr:DNA glycosylase [Mycena galopus ATCC 62051]